MLFDTMAKYETVYPDEPARHMDNSGMLSNKAGNRYTSLEMG